MFETFVRLNLAWFRAHGCEFKNGVPDANTFQYLFAHLDPALLSACLRSVAAKLRERLPFEVVSFDGKAARCGKCRREPRDGDADRGEPAEPIRKEA